MVSNIYMPVFFICLFVAVVHTSHLGSSPPSVSITNQGRKPDDTVKQLQLQSDSSEDHGSPGPAGNDLDPTDSPVPPVFATPGFRQIQKTANTLTGAASDIKNDTPDLPCLPTLSKLTPKSGKPHPDAERCEKVNTPLSPPLQTPSLRQRTRSNTWADSEVPSKPPVHDTISALDLGTPEAPNLTGIWYSTVNTITRPTFTPSLSNTSHTTSKDDRMALSDIYRRNMATESFPTRENKDRSKDIGSNTPLQKPSYLMTAMDTPEAPELTSSFKVLIVRDY